MFRPAPGNARLLSFQIRNSTDCVGVSVYSASRCQLLLRPSQACHFLSNDPPRPGICGLSLQLARMMATRLALHPRQQLLLELLTSPAPTPAQRLERVLAGFLEAACFDAVFELLPASRAITLPYSIGS